MSAPADTRAAQLLRPGDLIRRNDSVWRCRCVSVSLDAIVVDADPAHGAAPAERFTLAWGELVRLLHPVAAAAGVSA